MSDNLWFVNAYDEHVREAGAAVSVADARAAIARRYKRDVLARRIKRAKPSIEDEGRHLFDRWVMPKRSARTTNLRKNGQHLIDALRGNTILGRDDPYLDMAYPLGNGQDKTLRYWTAEDWECSRIERHRVADAEKRSARDFDDEVASVFIAELRRTGVRFTGDLPFAREEVAA